MPEDEENEETDDLVRDILTQFFRTQPPPAEKPEPEAD
jgi:hypothetical protein